MKRRLAQAILGLVAVFLVTPVGAEQSDEIVLNAHYGFSGVITKIESGMLFVRSDDNLRPRTISPNKADRVGLHGKRLVDLSVRIQSRKNPQQAQKDQTD